MVFITSAGSSAVAHTQHDSNPKTKLIMEDYRKMDKKVIIELFEAGCVDLTGETNIGLIEEKAYHDGERLGIMVCQLTPCEATGLLLTAENALKESFRLLDNKQFAELLDSAFVILDFEPWQSVEILVSSSEVFESYVQHFILGLSDAFLERALHCRSCRAQ